MSKGFWFVSCSITYLKYGIILCKIQLCDFEVRPGSGSGLAWLPGSGTRIWICIEIKSRIRIETNADP